MGIEFESQLGCDDPFTGSFETLADFKKALEMSTGGNVGSTMTLSGKTGEKVSILNCSDGKFYLVSFSSGKYLFLKSEDDMSSARTSAQDKLGLEDVE